MKDEVVIQLVHMVDFGIGRSMKVGKESICGVMAALQAWGRRDHQGIRAKEERILNLWHDGLKNIPGIRAEISPDPTGNPLERLLIRVDESEAGISAWGLALNLAKGDTPIVVRSEYVGVGAFELDPCNHKEGQPEVTLSRLKDELDKARTRNAMPRETLAEARRAGMKILLSWPD